MAQRWTVTYGTFTFEVATRFSLRSVCNFSEDGKVESIETLVALEGTLVGAAPDPAASATDKHIAIRDLIKVTSPLRLTLKLDNITKYDFKPDEAVGTPRLREIAEIPEGASHGTHVKYALTFYIKETARDKKAELILLESSAVFYKSQGPEGNIKERLLQQTWHAKAKGRTLKDAKDLVMEFKPKDIAPLLEQYHQSPKTFDFEATWTYDKTKGKGITFTTEHVRIDNSGHPIIPQFRTGNNAKPALHKARFRPGEVTLTFMIEATDPGLIERPDAHFAESGELIRDRTKEPIEDPAIFDSVRGMYRATYTEFWLYLGTTRPEPEHKADHEKPFPERTDVPKIKDGVDWVP
jgi:hypothetical protein